jgi:hypothetical protein
MRIATIKNLDVAIDELNVVTGNAKKSYRIDDAGKHRANVGNYNLHMAYGGHGLAQIDSNGGGVRMVFGLTTKKELYGQIRAMLAGIALAR